MRKMISLVAVATLLTSQLLLSGCIPVVIGATAGTVLASQDQRSITGFVDDQAIELKFKDRMIGQYTLNRLGRVYAVSYNGNLLILGQVPSADWKEKVTEIAKDIPHVREVYNELQVAVPLSNTIRAKDAYITTKVKARLLATKGIDSARIKVVTEDGTVYLMGLVSQYQGSKVTDAVQKVTDVNKVVKLFEYIG